MWIKISENYFEISSNAIKHANETQGFVNELKNDMEKLETEIEAKNCDVKIKVGNQQISKLTSEDSTLSESSNEEFDSSSETPIETSNQSFDESGPTDNIQNLISGFSFDDKTDFGAISKIGLDMISHFLEEAFGDMSWQNIFASLFTGVNYNASAFL